MKNTCASFVYIISTTLNTSFLMLTKYLDSLGKKFNWLAVQQVMHAPSDVLNQDLSPHLWLFNPQSLRDFPFIKALPTAILCDVILCKKSCNRTLLVLLPPTELSLQLLATVSPTYKTMASYFEIFLNVSDIHLADPRILYQYFILL